MIKMFLISIVLCSFVLLGSSVDPLTQDELRQIRDFTAKAHMKRQQFFPDQIMTPSTHYMGRRIPPNGEKQPNIFMQAPQNGGGPPKQQIEPQPSGAVQNFLINYPITTNTITQGPPPPPQQQQQLFFQQQPQQRPPQQQLQFINLQQNGPGGPGGPPHPHHQNGPPPPRGPPGPPPRRPSFFSFGGNGPESAPPTSLLQFFFPKRSARRPPSYRPPLRFEHAQTSYNPTALLQQHHQSLHSVMAQQHALAVQQQQIQQQQQLQQQQSIAQPSASPIQSAQSTTVKNSAQINPTVVAPSAPAPAPAPVIPAAQLIPQNAQQFFSPRPPHHIFSPNQFHRELSFFGKPPHHGKPQPPQKYSQPPTAYVPQNRPGDADNYIQKFVSPQSDFSFLNLGPHVPPVIAGPTRYNSPVSFSHIEQMPFAMHQSSQLPMHMVVQSQEFPHYHFTTHFTASNPGGASNERLPTSAPSPTGASNTATTTQQIIQNQNNQNQNIQNQNYQYQNIQHQNNQNQNIQYQNTPIKSNLDAHVASLQSSTIRQTQRVKKIRHRPAATQQAPTEPTTTTSPTTTQSLGELIFESAKETREFHDSAQLVPPTISNIDSSPLPQQKPRKPKAHKSQQQSEHAGSLQKASVESSSVVLAPLVSFAQTSDQSTTTSSPRPITSTLVSVSTISTQPTQPPFKASKVVKPRNNPDYHPKSKNHNNHNNHQNHNHERRVTASGSGFGAVVTAEPLRLTSTGTSTATSSASSSPKRHTQSPNSSGGRVVTTSVTSRVVSSGPHHHPNPQNHPHHQPHHQNPQKRYRLRKVKVPNPEAIKANNQKASASSTTTSFSSSSSTTNFPSSTTPLSSPRTPRSTSTATSTTSPSTPSASSPSSSPTISSTESSLTTTTV